MRLSETICRRSSKGRATIPRFSSSSGSPGSARCAGRIPRATESGTRRPGWPSIFGRHAWITRLYSARPVGAPGAIEGLAVYRAWGSFTEEDRALLHLLNTQGAWVWRDHPTPQLTEALRALPRHQRQTLMWLCRGRLREGDRRGARYQPSHPSRIREGASSLLRRLQPSGVAGALPRGYEEVLACSADGYGARVSTNAHAVQSCEPWINVAGSRAYLAVPVGSGESLPAHGPSPAICATRLAAERSHVTAVAA